MREYLPPHAYDVRVKLLDEVRQWKEPTNAVYDLVDGDYPAVALEFPDHYIMYAGAVWCLTNRWPRTLRAIQRTNNNRRALQRTFSRKKF